MVASANISDKSVHPQEGSKKQKWSVTGIFVLLKNCPRTKIFRKFLSYGIKFFVLGQKFSEKFCPTQIIFVLPHKARIKNFRKSSENFYPRTKIFRKILS